MKKLNLVVLIPAFNEENTIASVIKSIPAKIKGIEKISVLVVNDGSTDNTVGEAKKAGAHKIQSIKSNLGLGNAFKVGIEESLKMGADITVTIDADGQFNSADIPKLLEPILNDEADMVSCSRFKDKNLEPKMPWIKKFGNGIFTSMVNFLTEHKFSDTQCGFRAYSKEACLHLNTFGKHTYTQEVFLNLASKNIRIEEVACRVKGARDGKSKVVSNVFVYGLKALLIIARTSRDYNPLAFFGSIGIGMLSLGMAGFVAIIFRWIITGLTSPYTSFIPGFGIVIILGFLILMLAFIADMNGRQKLIQEEILYRLKKQEFMEKK